MNSRERVWAALDGLPVDRPPISFWGHRYDRESTAQDLVEATAESQRRWSWDFVKLNPRKSYFVEDWGVRYEYSGAEKPALVEWPIREAADWQRVRPQPAESGAYGEQLEAVRSLRRALPADVPFIQTIFSPLGVAGEMTERPEVARDHWLEEPQWALPALEAITATLEKYVPAVLEAGADGIYFATTHFASRRMLSGDQYARLARELDLRVLRAAAAARFNVLHVCKSESLLLELRDYPVHAFSWSATDPTNPDLGEGLARLRGALLGGISHEGALQAPDPAAVLEEFRRGLELTGGRRWMVGPGCSIPPETPAANLHALREAVEGVRVG